MESLRSVRVRQQDARARREPCPSRGSGQAQAVEPGGVQQYMAHHGRAATRVPALPAAVINVYLEVDIALWPASSPFGQLHVVGPAVGHMGVALGPVDFGVVEDHAWAGTVRSARNPARSSATMGRRRLLAARSFPRPRFPTRGCRRRRRVRRPGRLSGRTPRAWPGTACIGELTATGRSSSGQAGQLPALSGQTAFFRVLERILASGQWAVGSAVDAGRTTGRWTQRSCVHI